MNFYDFPINTLEVFSFSMAFQAWTLSIWNSMKHCMAQSKSRLQMSTSVISDMFKSWLEDGDMEDLSTCKHGALSLQSNAFYRIDRMPRPSSVHDKFLPILSTYNLLYAPTSSLSVFWMFMMSSRTSNAAYLASTFEEVLGLSENRPDSRYSFSSLLSPRSPEENSRNRNCDKETKLFLGYKTEYIIIWTNSVIPIFPVSPACHPKNKKDYSHKSTLSVTRWYTGTYHILRHIPRCMNINPSDHQNTRKRPQDQRTNSK